MKIKLNLNSNFKMVQEGERVLEITDAKVTPSGKPEKLQLTMKDVQDDAVLFNSYSFSNEKSIWAMGIMLNIALGIEDGEEFDTKDVGRLIGVKLLCEIRHSEYNDKTYANVGKVISRVDENGVVESFEEVEEEEDDL